VTLVIGYPASCRMASRCSSSLYLEFRVFVRRIGVVTLGVGLPASYRTASRCSSSLYSGRCFEVGAIDVAVLHGATSQKTAMFSCEWTFFCVTAIDFSVMPVPFKIVAIFSNEIMHKAR
jgi:hypothetical protein